MSFSSLKSSLKFCAFPLALLAVSACTQTVQRTNYVVFFDSESADITPAGEAVVNEAISVIKKTHEESIRISASSGHKNDDPRYRELSDKRAQSVVTSLEKAGIPSKDIHVIPFTPDDAEDSRVALRRVNIELGNQ